MKTKKEYKKPQMEIHNVRRTKAALLLYSGDFSGIEAEKHYFA